MTLETNQVIENLLRTGELFRQEFPLDKVIREMDAAKEDLQDAEDIFSSSRYKWATIIGYSSIFHSARTLLYVRGYKEHDQDSLIIALEQFYPEELGKTLSTAYGKALQLKRKAEEHEYSMNGAIETIQAAKAWLLVARNILKAK
ncbi:MAG TPA: HEPN domain-containing protein [Candidatus Binatus sp.]|nr:HEPN domain-containing protein [Candidatus Binatus sp.]